MILDTCADGGAEVKLVEKRSLSSEQIRALERVKDRTGYHILMGVADKASIEASPYALLQGMRGAALRDDQFVDVQKLFAHAVDRVPELAVHVGGIQQPIVTAPIGASFDVGQVTKEDKPLIPLSLVKPTLLRVASHATSPPVDTLRLSKMVNAQLREISVQARGGGNIVYIDADELPGAYTLSGNYRREGEVVKVGNTANLAREIVLKAYQVLNERNAGLRNQGVP